MYSTSAAADFTQPALAAYWDTWSEDGVPLFFAGTRRMMDREEEWQRAVETAAQQAARYIQVTGLSRFYTEKSSKGKGYFGDFQFQWDTSLEAGLVERLEEVKRAQDADGSYILVRFPEGAALNLPRQAAPGGGKPRWITELPRIPGYLVGIGSSQRKRYPSDSIAAADEQALEEIVKSLGMEVTTQRNTIDLGRQGSGTVQSSLEVAQATVRGFCVVARWYEPDRGVFYSLGVCPAEQNF